MLAPNTLLQDRYLIMRLLGQGGMGAVYQATDRKFGNDVAIKETFYNDIQLRKAFSHEARLLNRLRHAALPVVTDYFPIGDRQFLVMQYIPGKDLEQLLAERNEDGQGVFLTTQVLRWTDQLLDALEYLHSQKPPIIHRDIKPQNLKLTPRGEVILLDFGLAKGITTQQSQVSQSIRGYTPNYASLEQIRGTGTDPRSDIYSMGATIYHLLTGIMPQDAMTRIASMLMGHPDPLPPINELNMEVPAVVASVVEKAMSPHPDQRFSSAAMMRQALRNANLNIPTGNFHRTPTLTDEPMKNGMAAAAAAAVAFDRQVFKETSSLPQDLDFNPEPDPGNDHVIILLEDGSQEPARNSTVERIANSKRGQSSKQTGTSSSQHVLQPRKNLRTPLIAILTLSLFTILVGGGYRHRGFLKQRFLDRAPDLAKTTQINVAVPPLTIPTRVDALRYYLEIAPLGNGPTRATGLKPLAAGSQFKFHFKPKEDGYLYIVALGKGGMLQTFLTDKPMAASGVITNRVEAGRDFSFPEGEGKWFMIQRDADTTPFIVIYSSKPMKTPGFLSGPSGRDLTQTEVQELAELTKRLSTSTPEVVAVVDNDQPSVTVQVPTERPSDKPLIFDIKIDKRKDDGKIDSKK